ncbi:hypothetical protein A2867_00810 [Candidatus Daviesbacteria bacterium RIFCSPHIGHO2_01_FULL_40_11]|uniref:Uncharacterized protein n=1 Tax=Candidatus Daviesbacteria bacterium RIFCSPHIGHO2_01_FULL_40_11 TaxID=1797762 RepID=A0A1F5JLJ5_9BACT|nr:MAG: hypothetical protein A2867_00810 [Candidatus Daviesbacteria bacterium RIFCSPHIGHO2_01_FULL_40_11]
MQKGFVIVPILIGILVIGGVVGAWYTRIIQIPGFAPPGCYYKQVQCIQAPCNPILVCENASSNPMATPQTTPSPTASVSPAPNITDGTANWKTYTAAKFSFKYPPSWDLQTCGVPEGIYLDEDGVNCAGGSSAISIMNTFTKEFSFFAEKSRGILVKESSISLGGHNALQAEIDTGKVSGNSGFQYTITRIKLEDSIYDLEIEYNQVRDNVAARKIYNQILSTFKFLVSNRDKEDNSDCKITGCSGQICSDKDVVTTCEFLREYGCYTDAICERQQDGKCGWTPTEELNKCLGKY